MEDSLSAGNLLARRYRLIDRIGAGGMSVIWRARDEVLDRVVALKVLTPELAADQRYRDLVREEARSAAQLVHPNVTAVHDYGEMIGPGGDVTAFVVMELLSGESLARRLTAGPLPWPAALEICAQVAEALAAAHRIGVVHRDITPSNIMLTGGGVKVLDFGIATRVGAPDEDEEGDSFGTPAYVAPERLDGMPTQPATDTYALGVLLYETLTGRLPYPAETWEELARTPRHGPPPAPTGVPGLPRVVAELCRKCLSRSPLDRPTAHQVASELRANSDRYQPVPVAPARNGRTLAHPQPEQAAPGDPPIRRPVPTWVRVTTAVAAVVVALVTAAVVASELDRSSEPSAGALAPASQPPGNATPSGGQPMPTASAAEPGYRPASPPVPPSRTAGPGVIDGKAPLSVAETIDTIGQIIDAGLVAREIRPDAAVDLRNIMQNLRESVRQGTADLAVEAANLQDKVAARRREGAIIGGSADQLDSEFARLATL
jgi:serine/threonine-protein kinase